jgi:hypothetical protein
VDANRTLLYEWSVFDHLDVDYKALDPNDKVAGALN